MTTTSRGSVRRPRVSLFAGVASLVLGAAAHAQVHADSVADFSGVQGQGGWQYGFYEGTLDPSGFQQFPLYGTTPTLMPPGTLIWYRHPTNYWTLLSADSVHPEGSVCARSNAVNFAVRRWVSDVEGGVRVSISAQDTLSFCGNGIGVHVFHNALAVATSAVPSAGSFAQDLSLCLRPGDVLDFATDPNGGNECCDEFIFTITIHDEPSSGCTPACDPDVNCDGNLDGFDVQTMELAVGGNLADFCQADADFNRDGNLDGFDVQAVELTVGGGPCP